MKCKEMRIYFFLFLVLWAGSVYAQNQPVILDKHNVIELNDAKEWNRFIKSWEAVPLKMDARNAVEIQSLAVYDDLVVVREYEINGRIFYCLIFPESFCGKSVVKEEARNSMEWSVGFAWIRWNGRLGCMMVF